MNNICKIVQFAKKAVDADKDDSSPAGPAAVSSAELQLPCCLCNHKPVSHHRHQGPCAGELGGGGPGMLPGRRNKLTLLELRRDVTGYLPSPI